MNFQKTLKLLTYYRWSVKVTKCTLMIIINVLLELNGQNKVIITKSDDVI